MATLVKMDPGHKNIEAVVVLYSALLNSVKLQARSSGLYELEQLLSWQPDNIVISIKGAAPIMISQEQGVMWNGRSPEVAPSRLTGRRELEHTLE